MEMQLSRRSAQQIVEQIGKLVRQNINLMDESGHIIASTDPKRIGSFHQGAYRIISERLPELYITPEMETPSVRQGINLPLEVKGKVVGVIGITGGYQEVFSYGQIVKKMTEILIAEGEAEYMRILSEAYADESKQDFYSFVRSLDALKASMTGDNKTVILSPDSPIAQIFYGR